MSSTPTESWSGRLAFILASIGAAVGLGNIWKFPYTLGSSGGSAFVLVYVIAILLVATPIMIAEMVIGRHARASAPTAMRKVAERRRRQQALGTSRMDGIVCAVSCLKFLQRYRWLDRRIPGQVRLRVNRRFVSCGSRRRLL